MPETKVDAHDRTVLFVTIPALWPHWPFLPVVRRSRGEEEYGVVYDALGDRGQAGPETTVYLTNLFMLPESIQEFLNLPRETFDTAEDLAAAGWSVD